MRNFRERISCDFTFFCQNSFCEKFDLIWYHKLILVKGFNFWASKVFFSPKREQNGSIVLKNYKYCSSREFGRFLNIRHDLSRIIPYYGIIQYDILGLYNKIPFPYSPGRSTRYYGRLHDFSVTISSCYKDAYVNRFFPRPAKLWNSLPIKCFPLTYDFSGFKSRINKHLLTVGSF